MKRYYLPLDLVGGDVSHPLTERQARLYKLAAAAIAALGPVTLALRALAHGLA